MSLLNSLSDRQVVKFFFGLFSLFVCGRGAFFYMCARVCRWRVIERGYPATQHERILCFHWLARPHFSIESNFTPILKYKKKTCYSRLFFIGSNRKGKRERELDIFFLLYQSDSIRKSGAQVYWIFLNNKTPPSEEKKSEKKKGKMAIIVVTGSTGGSRRDPSISSLTGGDGPTSGGEDQQEKDSGCDQSDLWMLSPSAASVLCGHLPITAGSHSRHSSHHHHHHHHQVRFIYRSSASNNLMTVDAMI